MGNIVEKISEHKTEAILAAGLAYLGSLLYKEIKEKEQLRDLLKKAIESKQVGKEIFGNELNQVYLKQQVEHHSIRNHSQHPIYKIAVTGGPCAGKSTSLDRIKQEYTKRGFRVLCVPQIPTMVVVAGGMIMMSKFNVQERIKFQSLLIRFQMYAEDYFTRLAEMSKSPAIVLCDRGTVDPAAYVSAEEFQAIMDQEGWSLVTLRDRRYDRVIYMVSAANGAEQFYSLANNVARHEGIQTAKNLDKRTLEVWTGHPHITVCPNVKGETFQDKINRAMKAVHKTIGVQLTNNFYQKYLINEPKFPHLFKAEISDIQEIFLINDDPKWDEDKIKKRGQHNSYTYQRKYRAKKGEEGDYRQQIRQPLTSLQYVMLREQKSDKNYSVVNRQRIHFIWNNLAYSIDIYNNILGQEKVYLLRFSNNQRVEGSKLVPDFIQAIKEVRDDPQYSLRSIAKIAK